MKAIRQFSRLAALSLVSVTLLANHVRSAVITYNFDVNGASQVPSNFGVTSSSTYDWDDTANGGFWSNNSTSTTGNIATNGWVQGNFPKFQPSGTPTYIVTVGNVEQVAGMFFSTAQNLTINATGAGALDIVTGLQGVLGSGSADVTINAPITGVGEPQFSNGGNLRLNGTNTYSGGTNLSSTSTLIHFNNSASFGTNFINMGVAGFVPLLASGGATVTLPNNFTTSVSGAGINFAADANTPVVSTGTWTLGANNLVLRNNGVATSPLTLSNVISGAATVTLSSNTGGTIIFSGANLYTGATTVGGIGTNSSTTIVTLKLGAANTIATSSSVIMTGGTLDPGGFNQTMSSTTLALLGTTSTISTIDYISGASEVDFANSSAVAWTAGKILNLTNWDFATTKLRFGTDSTGLTASQLSKIEFNGGGLGTAQLDANGYVVIPEPSSIALLMLGLATLAGRRRGR